MLSLGLPLPGSDTILSIVIMKYGGGGKGCAVAAMAIVTAISSSHLKQLKT